MLQGNHSYASWQSVSNGVNFQLMTRETDLIKERLDLVDFLRSYLKLLPAGKNFKALCPFHAEKTPSFVVSPERKMWHCFGCGLGGDLITFVMRHENLEFPEAIRFLAEKAGVAIATLNPALEKQFGILYKIHESAKSFYAAELSKNEEARKYLKARGLAPQTIEEFGLGFAPGGESLTLHLIKLGFDVLDVVKAGLANKNLDGLYRDRFQGRLIFPISNSLGKTVAFTGRLLREEGSKMPKYLNSPETPIFSKSRILYGFDKSKGEIAGSRTVFIVEGQMDFLMAWQTGVKNVVAVSGTGLTGDHLARLKRVADTVILSFDNDDAGERALERALDIFNNYDFHAKVVDLGKFKDPAEAAAADEKYLTRAIEGATPALRSVFEHHFAGLGKDIAEKKRVLRKMLSKIQGLRSRVEASEWLKELSRFSGISEVALSNELENLPLVEKSEPEAAAVGAPAEKERMDLISARLLSLAFTNPVFRSNLTPYEEWLPARYRKILADPKVEEGGLFELRGSYEFADKDEEALTGEFNELVRQLQIESLKRELEELREEIRSAEAKGESGKLSDVIVRFNVVARKINELK